MGPALIVLIVFGGLVLLVLMAVVGMYNSLVNRKNQVEYAFASVDALLKKRYDLIPNLVATVQQYMQHESKTFSEITALRSKALSGTMSPEDAVAADATLTKALRGIMVQVENYPTLRASENFQHLQSSLNEVEEQISAGRRAFNAAVMDLNNAVEMFPTNIIAGMMNFRRRQPFEIPEAERQNVNVKELFRS